MSFFFLIKIVYFCHIHNKTNLLMSVIYMLITISIAVALLFFCLFIIAVRNGQYDDSHTPAVRMLFEDELIDEKQQDTQENNKTN